VAGFQTFARGRISAFANKTVGLIQKIDNIDLYRRMMELSTQVYALFEETVR
jgi:hypothetical protein